MTTERLAELVEKVKHGFNLINSEAREVLEHFGVGVEQRKRCEVCGGDGRTVVSDHGSGSIYDCPRCHGSGYEVRK